MKKNFVVTALAALSVRAQDGAVLSCRLAWSSRKSPEGVCLDKDDKEYQVRFD